MANYKKISLKDFEANETAMFVHDVIEHTTQSIVLTGKAGTGKSTFLKAMLEATQKRKVVLGSTGMAAKNIGGQTVHAFFQIPFTLNAPTTDEIRGIKLKYNRKKIAFIKKAELIVIDEVSMLHSCNLDYIDALLRNITGSSESFGGKQLLLVGDPFQLPPVLKKEVKEKLLTDYKSEHFFDAKAFNANFVMAELTHCYRQKDLKFMTLLDAVRSNSITSEMLDEFNHICYENANQNLDDALILTGLTEDAEFINDEKLRSISNYPSQKFRAESTGIFNKNNCLAKDELRLKKDARVMFIKNGSEFYCNGTLGVVQFVSADKISVKTEDDNVVEVPKAEWQEIKYGIDKTTDEFKEEVVGSYIQYPLILAWALTIHKSQGLTLNRVHLDNTNRIFAPGQLYVALSRCTSIEQLSFTKPIQMRDVIVDERVVEFYDELHSEEQQAQISALLKEIVERKIVNS